MRRYKMKKAQLFYLLWACVIVTITVISAEARMQGRWFAPGRLMNHGIGMNPLMSGWGRMGPLMPGYGIMAPMIGGPFIEKGSFRSNMEELAESLALTEEQIEIIEEKLEAFKEEVESIRENIRELKIDLRRERDKDVREELIEEIKAERDALMLEQQLLGDDIFNVLTADQKTILEEEINPIISIMKGMIIKDVIKLSSGTITESSSTITEVEEVLLEE